MNKKRRGTTFPEPLLLGGEGGALTVSFDLTTLDRKSISTSELCQHRGTT